MAASCNAGRAFFWPRRRAGTGVATGRDGKKSRAPRYKSAGMRGRHLPASPASEADRRTTRESIEWSPYHTGELLNRPLPVIPVGAMRAIARAALRTGIYGSSAFCPRSRTASAKASASGMTGGSIGSPVSQVNRAQPARSAPALRSGEMAQRGASNRSAAFHTRPLALIRKLSNACSETCSHCSCSRR